MKTIAENVEKVSRIVCNDPRHETPCPQPCEACDLECDPKHKSPLEVEV